MHWQVSERHKGAADSPLAVRGYRQRNASLSDDEYAEQRAENKRARAKEAYYRNKGASTRACSDHDSETSDVGGVITQEPQEAAAAVRVLQHTEFVRAQTDTNAMDQNVRVGRQAAVPHPPALEGLQVLVTAVALDTLLSRDAAVLEKEGQLFAHISQSVDAAMGWDGADTRRLSLTNCKSPHSLLVQRASYNTHPTVKSDVNKLIQAGWEYLQFLNPTFSSHDVDDALSLAENLCSFRAATVQDQPLYLRSNREGRNNQFLAQYIMDRHTAQYRAARSEPHYLFKETTLDRTLLVVDTDITEDMASNQASAYAANLHDIQVQYNQRCIMNQKVTVFAVGGDEGTTKGQPGQSFLCNFALGVIDSTDPPEYHDAYTDNDRFRSSLELCHLGSGSGKGKKTAAALAPHMQKHSIEPFETYPSYHIADDAAANPKVGREYLRQSQNQGQRGRRPVNNFRQENSPPTHTHPSNLWAPPIYRRGMAVGYQRVRHGRVHKTMLLGMNRPWLWAAGGDTRACAVRIKPANAPKSNAFGANHEEAAMPPYSAPIALTRWLTKGKYGSRAPSYNSHVPSNFASRNLQQKLRKCAFCDSKAKFLQLGGL